MSPPVMDDNLAGTNLDEVEAATPDNKPDNTVAVLVSEFQQALAGTF